MQPTKVFGQIIMNIVNLILQAASYSISVLYLAFY